MCDEAKTDSVNMFPRRPCAGSRNFALFWSPKIHYFWLATIHNIWAPSSRMLSVLGINENEDDDEVFYDENHDDCYGANHDDYLGGHGDDFL